jgi:hypothetical protein
MRNYKVQYKNSYQYQVKQRHRKKVSSSASIMFSSYDPMGPVSYCHHLASVVCQPLLTFQMLIISCETAGTIRTKHAWMMFVRFFTKFHLDTAKNMATVDSTCSRLAKCGNILSTETTCKTVKYIDQSNNSSWHALDT